MSGGGNRGMVPLEGLAGGTTKHPGRPFRKSRNHERDTKRGYLETQPLEDVADVAHVIGGIKNLVKLRFAQLPFEAGV